MAVSWRSGRYDNGVHGCWYLRKATCQAIAGSKKVLLQIYVQWTLCSVLGSNVFKRIVETVYIKPFEILIEVFLYLRRLYITVQPRKLTWRMSQLVPINAWVLVLIAMCIRHVALDIFAVGNGESSFYLADWFGAICLFNKVYGHCLRSPDESWGHGPHWQPLVSWLGWIELAHAIAVTSFWEGATVERTVLVTMSFGASDIKI